MHTHKHHTQHNSFSRVRIDRMNEIMRRHLDIGRIPGLVMLVHHHDREYMNAFGTHGFNSSTPMGRETIFRLASMTKPITAVAAMILVEECKIRLDDPVEIWLPELKERRVLRKIDSPLDDTVAAKRAISVRDLLTCRSGYGEVMFSSPTCPLQNAMTESKISLSAWPFNGSPDEFMKGLSVLPLACQPGEQWLYHLSSEILGVLISRVTGKSLGDFFEERIFGPLEMKDTAFFVPPKKIDRLPLCYGTNFPSTEMIILDETREGMFARPPVFESGGGGLVSTVDDLAAFGHMMLNKGVYGNERILSRPAIELMTMDHITQKQKNISPFFEKFWNDHSWGLGLSVGTGRSNIFDIPGRFGWDGAFGTSWYVDPKEELIGILMVQRRPDVLAIPPVTLDFWTSAYQLIDY
jgi:CubicO group peptidase (beta-lactamase class C family)